MAPKGSPRMLIAASLLVSDRTLSVKGALSKAGFSAEEIAKEKKQRQARRRRDYLLKKKATMKIKGQRTMSSLPQTMTNAQKLQYNNQQLKRNEQVMNHRKIKQVVTKIHGEKTNNEDDTSRMDALLFACSMQESLLDPPMIEPADTSTLSLASASSADSSTSDYSMMQTSSVTALPTAAELDKNEFNLTNFAPLDEQNTSSEIFDFSIFSSL